MTDWSSMIQMLYRVPGLIVGIVFIAAAFAFHLRRPGVATIAQIAGSLIAFLGYGVSVIASTMMNLQFKSSGAGSEFKDWMGIATISSLTQMAGALIFSIALLVAILGLPRSESR